MTAHILVTASNELGTRKRFKKPASASFTTSRELRCTRVDTIGVVKQANSPVACELTGVT